MMASKEDPLVSVVTPVYNTEEYLRECIESILEQSHTNFEYIIVDNCSTDGSAGIAESFSRRDSRIRVVRNKDFLYQCQNYNHALRQISDKSRYCKIVQADDWIFPNCLSEMVAVAETNPSIGIVGACTLLDFGKYSDVYLTGLPYPSHMISGRDVCRRFLLDGTYVFGSPTATLFRSEIVRSRDAFYDENSVFIDTKICLDALQSWDFGFVYQILTYTRRYNDSFMSVLRHYHFMTLTELIAIRKYGPIFLTDKEYSRRRAEIEKRYHRALGESLLRRYPREFWKFQNHALAEIDETLNWLKLAKWGLGAFIDLALNPKQTAERLWHYKSRTASIDVKKVEKFIDIRN
jgi:glycosyltransferase involved in cell wall biosynthesis